MNAGTKVGLQVWNCSDFSVKKYPEGLNGTFYDGDSYIILNTYKPDPKQDTLKWNIHFWLGKDTSIDERGVAAYKTVELDDFLSGAPVQYREVQGFESEKFLALFPKVTVLHGGVASAFKHVSQDEKHV